MIRINLLPVREARRKADLRKQGVLLGVAATCGVVIALGMHISIKSQISSQRATVVVKKKELKALEETRKEVKRFQVEQEEIERKLDVITQIEKARSGPVRIMDDIAKSIPSRVWLRKMTAKSGKLNLSGLSLDPEIVADFASRLETSSMISGVQLQETSVTETEGLKLNRFTLKANYPYLKPTAAASAKKKRKGRRGRRRK